MSDYRERKAYRVKLAQAQSAERANTRKVTCCACNGSGHYDNTGSPKCGSCNGTGKLRVKI